MGSNYNKVSNIITRGSIKLFEKRTFNIIVFVIFFALGVSCFLIAIFFFSFDKSIPLVKSEILYQLLNKVGTTLIVTGAAWGVLSRFKGIIENIYLEKKEEERKLHEDQFKILKQAEVAGIDRIYSDRGTTDDAYTKSLIKHLDNVQENGTVKIIGVTLARFFGPHYKRELLTKIFRMLERGVEFELLILNPMSDSARARAITDQGDLVQEHSYVASTILNDALGVARRLKYPTSDWCLQESLIDKIKDQIKIRYYSTNPVLHLIILDKYIYIEHYHNGGGKYVRQILQDDKRYSNLPNYAGLVPVFKVRKESFYGKVMVSHFDNIWNSEDAQGTDLRTTNFYEELFKYKRGLWKDSDEDKNDGD